MHSADGRWVLTYNGELYNAAELASELARDAGITFRGRSDTEVLVEALAHWGVERSLGRFNGMFAFAAFDRRQRELFLVRDRLGIKPLYFSQVGGSVLFGSELRALSAYPEFRPQVDLEVVASFLRFSVVPGRRSIFQGVERLRPGTFAVFNSATQPPRHVSYWDAASVAEQGRRQPWSAGFGAAEEELRGLLRDSARRQMIADVPVGALLSGGIDSSTAVALMQRERSTPVRTFSIGFREAAYDELPQARRVAQALGTEHTELLLTPEQALAVIARLPAIYDEPFADASQIPTFLVSEFARRHVKVALSGDGGDELFGGYNRYLWLPRIWQKIARCPLVVRRALAAGIAKVQPSFWDAAYRWIEPRLSWRWRARVPGDKLHKLARVMAAATPEAGYLALCSQWLDPLEVVGDAGRESESWTDADVEGTNLLERMMLHDLSNYLPDDILTKVDRASMAVGLEVRVPYLDHRVVELAWSLPLDLRIRNGEGKAPLRSILSREVPREVLEQPKMGFGIPLAAWLRGPLREWAEDLLSEASLTRVGCLRAAPIRNAWKQHLSGQVNADHRLWPVLMYCQWAQAHGLA